MRKSVKALQGKERDSMIVHPLNGSKVLTIERKNGGEAAFIVFNFGKEECYHTLPANGSYNKIFDSTISQSNGETTGTPQIIKANESFSLKPCSAIILEQIKQ